MLKKCFLDFGFVAILKHFYALNATKSMKTATTVEQPNFNGLYRSKKWV